MDEAEREARRASFDAQRRWLNDMMGCISPPREDEEFGRSCRANGPSAAGHRLEYGDYSAHCTAASLPSHPSALHPSPYGGGRDIFAPLLRDSGLLSPVLAARAFTDLGPCAAPPLGEGDFYGQEEERENPALAFCP